MAFTRAVGDTSISTEKAYGSLRTIRPVSPLTARTSTLSRQSPGRSNLIFGSTNVPQPARTAAPPDVASEGPRRISGTQEPFGNPIAGAIVTAGKRIGAALADRPSPLPTGVPGITTSDIPATTGFFSPVTDFFGFTSPPAFSDFTASLATLKEGGFVRRKS
jgi:hypothetical protein